MSKNILGIDYGETRIGLAIASDQALLPRPHGILRNDDKIIEEIDQIIRNENVSDVIVGLPRNQSGQETKQTGVVREFAKQLKSRLPVDISFADESLSSRRAESIRREFKDRKKGEPIDDLAACFILEEFINSRSK